MHNMNGYPAGKRPLEPRSTPKSAHFHNQCAAMRATSSCVAYHIRTIIPYIRITQKLTAPIVVQQVWFCSWCGPSCRNMPVKPISIRIFCSGRTQCTRLLREDKKKKPLNINGVSIHIFILFSSPSTSSSSSSSYSSCCRILSFCPDTSSFSSSVLHS